MTSSPADTGDLLLRVTRRLRRSWGEALAPWHISPHEARALRVVVRGPVRPTDLAAQLRITARSVTEVADALQDKGLLVRSPSPTDRRATLLVATPEAERTAAELAQARGVATDQLLAALAPTEQETLRDLLARLLEENAGGADREGVAGR